MKQCSSKTTPPSTPQRTHVNGSVKNISTLSWPAKSPDQNPVENLWSILARQVYAAGRQYSSKEELWNAVQECLSKIPEETKFNKIRD